MAAAARKRDPLAKELFLERLRKLGHTVERDTVLARDNVYRVDGHTNLLVRTSRFHESRRVYFFGLTRHIFDNFSQLPNSVIAFVYSDKGEALLMPAAWLWERRSKLSADAKQFKLEIDDSHRLSARGAKPIDLAKFHESFGALSTTGLLAPSRADMTSKALSAKHAAVQGMLLEIGNLRGMQTYCANKAPVFQGKPLGQIATLHELPEFPGLNTDIVRNIDVIWLEKLFPTRAFEVEITTGIWTGLVRLGELRRLNTALHIVTDGDERAFKRRISGDVFAAIAQRCHHATVAEVRELFDAETRLSSLKTKIAL